MTSFFTLLFPQWQGSGSPEASLLERGAEQIAQRLVRVDARVNLSPSKDLETQAGIRGREQLLKQLEKAAAILARAEPTHLFTLGGDCGVDLATASYLNARHSDLALVWLDAHGDLNAPASSPSGAFHGMILRTLLGESDADFLDRAFSTFEPEQVFLAGARDFDPPEKVFAEGLEHLSVEILEQQPEALAEKIAARGFGKLHIHLDLDVLEPADFAATGYPTPRGLSIKRLMDILETLGKRFEIVGLTLAEFTPKEEGDAEKVRGILEVVP